MLDALVFTGFLVGSWVSIYFIGYFKGIEHEQKRRNEESEL